MSTKKYVVRIVKPSDKPTLPPSDPLPRLKPKSFLKRPFNILAGSGIGIATGMMIYLMLKSTGISFGGFESSVIIALPSILGFSASLVIC